MLNFAVAEAQGNHTGVNAVASFGEIFDISEIFLDNQDKFPKFALLELT